MNKTAIIVIGVVTLLLGVLGWQRFFSSAQPQNDLQSDRITDESREALGSVPVSSAAESVIPINTQPRYLIYTKNAFDGVADKKRVYFFHASWCPTCKIAHEDFTKNADKIPGDVVLFKTNYDTESALKKQYTITYQHTFVLVDSTGKEITKWNGGGITELISHTK